jgi:hypothetical protein
MGNFSPSSSHIPDAGIIKIEFLSAKGFFSLFFEKNMWMQTFLVECHISHNSRPLINSPSQNEIVCRFPGRVHSLVVRWFPVWTPSQTPTVAIDLCGVNGLVAVHRPNLRKTKVKDQYDTPIPMNINDNLPSSIQRLNKRPNISSFRPMPYLLSNP